MKVLSSIKVVQFFLFEQYDVRVSEIGGIFGPNGSGKSSLLDAVQIAMFGANTRLTSFNAQADENQSNTRSIRSYCLGQYGDSENERVRDRATTYITLVWRDEETQELLSMGVCLYAGIEREGHEVLGRYLIRGVELSMGDHLELVNGKQKPRDWASFRHQLQDRSKVTGEDPLFNDSERYVRAMLVALRGSGGVPHYDAFIRAFRFALRMRFDRPVDQIVRNQVLEARPTNIKKFKEVTESFKRLSAMVADVERKILEGEAIEKDFAKAHDEWCSAISWRALAADVAQKQATNILDTAVQRLDLARTKRDDAAAKFDATDAARRHAEEEAARYQSLKEQHNAHAQSGALQSQIEEQRAIASNKASELAKTAGALRRIVRDAARSKFLSDCLPVLTDSIEPLDQIVDSQARRTQSDVLAGVKPALKAVSSALSELFNKRRQIENDLEQVNKNIEQAQENLNRGKEGRPALGQEVGRLLVELRNAGLGPTPVCDLVRITDSTWQSAIEGYLGMNVQALLVSENEERTAFGVYRGLTGHRMIVGAKIVMESRYLTRRSPVSGSVAELIDGTHSSAVNYLRSKFGDARRASTDAECLASRHALTADGMLVSDGEIDRKPQVRPAQFRIGAGSREQLTEIERELVQLRQQGQVLQVQSEQASTLYSQLQLFGGEAATLERFTEICRARDASQEALDLFTNQLKDSASEEYLNLVAQESKWRGVARQCSLDAQTEAGTKGGAQAEVEQSEKSVERAELDAKTKTTAAHEARAAAGYDREFASRKWDALLGEHGSNYPAMSQACESQSRNCGNRMNASATAGSNKLGQFLGTHREQIEQRVVSDWRQSRKWIDDLLHRLRDTTLQDYREQMDDAYRTSQATFRNDVALALHENLKWLELTQDRLNEVLRTCPVFSNGERYKFKRTSRPAFASLLVFIKDVAENGPTQDLLGGAGDMPEEFRQLMEEKTIPGAGAVKSPLDDYREFFEFDIEIYREDPFTKATKIVGHLSKRLGSGSGGEHRAPLYVIAGAALASAYRLEKGSKAGVRLILLDEAFNKMDMGNIIATMRYLEDLGLQVLMASPGENLGTLTAFLHRYYDILRDAERNVLRLQGHDVSPETRAMFREDLPEFSSQLLDDEIRNMSPQEISGRTGT